MTVRPELEAEVKELYSEHAASLKRHASGILRSDDLADDAVQEAFMRYFVERSYGRAIAQPRAWLYTVLRHYVFDRMSQRPAGAEVNGDHLRGIADPGSGPEDQVRHSEMAGEMAASLSTRERECLGLRSEGFSYLEIAAIMGLKTGTVGALLVRAHNKIRGAARQSHEGESHLAGAVYQLLRGLKHHQS